MANQNRVAAHPVLTAAAGMLSLAVAMGIGRFAFTPMLPLMIADGQLDVAAGGWIAAANYAGYLLGAMTAARLQWSAKRLCVVALVLTVLLTAAMAAPLPPAVWAALRLAAGVCSAWAFVGTAVWCLGGLAAAGKPAWSSAVYAGVGIGITVAGLLCLAAASAGARAPATWLQLAALGVALLVPVAFALQDAPSVAPGVAPAAPAAARPAAPKAQGGTAMLIACYGVLGFGYILPATFLPVMARSVVEDPRLFGLAWPVFGITAAASTFVAGWMLRHASRLQVWALAHVLMGLGALLPSVWLNGLTIALSALLVGGTFMIVTMLGVQEMRARAAGSDATMLVGRMTAAFALGQIAGPIVSSLLLHVPGFATFGLDLALQAAAISLFASAAVLWRVQRQSQRLQEPVHVR